MLKHFFTEENEIPENLKGAYTLKGNRFELVELDREHPVVKKNKELLGINAALTGENNALVQDKTRLETVRLPDGMVAVEPEIEKLGAAAKAANLKAGEIQTLKTRNDELNNRVAEVEGEKVIDEVADFYKFNNKFKAQAKKDKLRFEKGIEKVDGKDVDVWFALLPDETKTVIPKFLETDSFYKEIADTFTDANQTTRRFAAQMPDNRQPLQNKFDRIREEAQTKQSAVIPRAASIADRFYNRTSGVTD